MLPGFDYDAPSVDTNAIEGWSALDNILYNYQT